MTESQKWRPPLAPKPSLQVAAVRERGVSPALRGATVAFSPANATSSAPAATKTPNGALGAATIAERAKREQDQKTLIDIRDAKSPVRGRLPIQRTGDYQKPSESKNPLHRTASEIAAKAANANSSPSRSRTVSNRQKYPSISTRSSSRESAMPQRGRLPAALPPLPDNPVPALPPESSSPPRKMPGHSPEKPQLSFDNIPILSQPPATNSMPPKLSVKPESRSFLQNNSIPITTTKTKPPSPPPKRHPLKSRDNAPKAEQAHPTSPSSTPNQHLIKSADVLQPPDLPPKATLPIPVPRQHAGRTSPRTIQPADASPRSQYGSMTPHSLADAMVASSLASRHGSRAASPVKFHPNSLPRRRSKSMDLMRPSHTGEKTAPLKAIVKRPMRQTMRKHSPEDEEEEEDTKRGRKHRIRKHPNMHHEGDRKRWRDKVTERERKRFEGVWAANRGLLHEYESDAVRRAWRGDLNSDDAVLNVVVREIWCRSRLPSYALEEIWDLVATGPDDKALNREQFVVGLWLVDQRLKGRKLPIKVSPSVWASVRYVGIKVKSKPF